MARLITGSGKVIRSRTTGLFSSQSVSPVVGVLRPTAAQMFPALDFLDLLALVRVHLEEAANPLPLALGRVEHGGARS